MCSPQEACSYAEESAGENDEGLVVVVIVVEEGGCVEDIGGTTCEKGEVGSEDVVDAAAEDAEYGEGGVEGSEGVVGGSVVHLASTTHS